MASSTGQDPTSTAIDFFEMSLDHLCITGFDGNFVRVNPAWERTLGWSLDELMSRPSIELVHPDDRAATLGARRQLHDGGVLTRLVNRYACKDGTYRWFEWRSIAEIKRKVVYAAARDITDQKHVEDQLRESREHEHLLERQLLRADRMASVGTLAAGAAHQINNPLACVSANLALMLEELATVGPTISAVQLDDLKQMGITARTAVESIREVVRGLTTFSHTTVEQRVSLEVERVVQLAIGLTANEIHHRARLVTEFGPTPPIEADETRLAQVIVNLLVNAMQAIPEGDSPRHEVRIVTGTDDGRAVIEIRDTGVGIPHASLGRIFDPFFTTKAIGVGTGLGLSICHNIVTGLGGTIDVTTALGEGSSFRVLLPPARAATIARPAVVATLDSASRAKVLVVDDEAAIGVTLTRVLRAHDVTAVTAAKDALSLLETGQRYDLILSDLMMPEMSGMELFDELSRRFPDAAARVVFISGGAFTANATTFLAQVPNERLEKPFDPHTIRALARRFAR
ncbi:MAG: ATP-binding protein [Kofleriaceae bacterium]